MSKKGNNKETPEWVDRDDNAAKNNFTLHEERPHQNAPKVRSKIVELSFRPELSRTLLSEFHFEFYDQGLFRPSGKPLPKFH